MNNTAIDNRNLKKLLLKKLQNTNISVTQGTGTASGWKHINITMLAIREPDMMFSEYPENIKEKFHNARMNAENIVRQHSQTLGHYYADDGYNTYTDEVLVSVKGTN